MGEKQKNTPDRARTEVGADRCVLGDYDKKKGFPKAVIYVDKDKKLHLRDLQ